MTYLQLVKQNKNSVKSRGHNPVSSGCGMFRCQKCNLSAYLDEDPQNLDSRWLEQCPEKQSTT